jgi:hypothetical protein
METIFFFWPHRFTHCCNRAAVSTGFEIHYCIAQRHEKSGELTLRNPHLIHHAFRCALKLFLRSLGDVGAPDG